MGRRISFFVTEDEVSRKTIDLLNGLVEELKDKVKVSSTSFIGSALTNMKVKLESSFGKYEELEISVHAILNDYMEAFKSRFGLPELPAVRFGEQVFTGEDVANVASDLRSLLTSGTYLTAEQVFYHLANYIQRLAEIEERKAAIRAAETLGESNVYRAALRDRMAKLERLLNEGRIDVETYRKMKQVYEELLSGKTA